MSEKKLMEALGPPLSVKEEGEGKTFEYQTWTNNLHGKPVYRHDWHVHLVAGKVDSFGLDAAIVPPEQPGPAARPKTE
jgi:hypothetical protein